MPSSQLREIHLVNEGIENLFKKQIRTCSNFDEFIDRCTSKRYSGARITRTITHILVNTLKEEVEPLLKNKPTYIRVLGFNKQGQEYLNEIRKDVETPIPFILLSKTSIKLSIVSESISSFGFSAVASSTA